MELTVMYIPDGANWVGKVFPLDVGMIMIMVFCVVEYSVKIAGITQKIGFVFDAIEARARHQADNSVSIPGCQGMEDGKKNEQPRFIRSGRMVK
eukprot:scaffold94_cov71-Skeletonema_dohrnii-CCMP3373.AAC.3